MEQPTQKMLNFSAYKLKRSHPNIQSLTDYKEELPISHVAIKEKYITRPDVLSFAIYRLYLELEQKGFKPSEIDLFGENIEIEHLGGGVNLDNAKGWLETSPKRKI